MAWCQTGDTTLFEALFADMFNITWHYYACGVDNKSALD